MTAPDPRGAAPVSSPPSRAGAAFPIGTRVRNKRTGELGTVVAPRPSTFKIGDIAIQYDDDENGTTWAHTPSSLEAVEECDR